MIIWHSFPTWWSIHPPPIGCVIFTCNPLNFPRSNGSCALTEKNTRRTRPGRLYAANSSRLDSFLFLFFVFLSYCLFFPQYGTDCYKDTSVVTDVYHRKSRQHVLSGRCYLAEWQDGPIRFKLKVIWKNKKNKQTKKSGARVSIECS